MDRRNNDASSDNDADIQHQSTRYAYRQDRKRAVGRTLQKQNEDRTDSNSFHNQKYFE